MPGGIYAALSGLRTRNDSLERIAEDISNASTAGYKGDRTTMVASARPSFQDVLATAMDVTSSAPKVDFRDGAVVPTGRDLDFAIEGPGFFSVETANGIRYTRNGHFSRTVDGTIVTLGGEPLLSADGNHLVLPPGKLEFTDDGTIRVGKTTVGRPAVTAFKSLGSMVRENGIRFKAPDGVTGDEATDSRVRPGMLEQSNVSSQERLAQMIDASRSFDALQRGINLLSSELDGRAIAELGRR